MRMIAGFKAFIFRGNVIDLAVAVVIGAAFGAVVKAFVDDLLSPLIGIPGQIDFVNARFTINGSVFRYGAFINAVIAFVLVATVVYFAVVAPISRVRERLVKPPSDVATRECPECLSSIPRRARRCSFCTAEVTPTL